MTDRDYEDREIRGHMARLRQIEAAPLGDRKAGERTLGEELKGWARDEKDDYLTERVAGWAYNGSFGAGIYHRFRNMKGKVTPRTLAIWLFTEAAMLEFQTSAYFVRKAFKAALPNKADQERFTAAVMAEIKSQDDASE